MRTRVKVCGVTRREDAIVAVESGADAIGFVFAPSPRRIDPDSARAIRRSLPPFVSIVGVFVDETPETVAAVARRAGLSVLQLHGDESPEDVARLAEEFPVVKAFRVRDPRSLERIEEFEAASAFLFDAYVPGVAGGTGQTFNWSLLDPSRFRSPRPWLLAGGLTPENVGEAIRQCRPYGVDTSSGVESAPGIKDAGKVRRFIQRVRENEDE